ncbi:putative catalytic domain of family 2 polysaccharide deacetylases [Candidatus Termititenax aidoneus]|uniref:Catalytic domain of family 2 polysaccharide deacetylases n=1 Tax=Termititenax aidoneus TaxID=2218524 RepID=A0A388TB39_TERA1|nr:putative catalytic domain of family 2 polysaccharide deacetylases [Candidatus Termititenax aidoneus]
MAKRLRFAGWILFLILLAIAAAAKPKMAVVIDDVGYSLAEAKALAALEYALTFAVIPAQPYSSASAAAIAASGRHAVLIHMPWTPLGNRQAYPVRIESGYSAENIRQMLDRAFASVPQAAGLNNHQGSILSADAAMMERFMRILSERGENIYFLDSNTTVNSRAQATAWRHGIPAARNNIFLDGTQTEEYIARRFAEAVNIAGRRGAVVAICHSTRPVTKRVLKKLLNKYNEQVDFVLLPEIIQAKERR